MTAKSANAPPTPAYAERLAQHGVAAARALHIQERCGNLRLLAFALTGLLLWLHLGLGASAHWMWLPLLAFVFCVVQHGRASRAEVEATRLVDHYRRGQARLAGKPLPGGPTGTEFDVPGHPYARDLDVLGPHSLFERLALGVTRAGDRTLAGYLLEGAAPATCIERKHALEELRDRLDVRERWLAVGSDVSRAVDRDGLGTWALAAPQFTPRPWLRALLVVQSLISCAALLGWAMDGVPLRTLLLVLAAHTTLQTLLRRSVQPVLQRVEEPAIAIGLLGRLLEILEQTTLDSPLLQALKLRLASPQRPPSVELASLDRWASLAASRRNPFFLPISGLLCLGPHVAGQIETWRARVGPRLPSWLGAVGEFEALLSLAAYAFEQHQDPYPEWEAGACLVAQGLSHPLLPADRAVANDLSLGAPQGPQAWVVSGSNMSGKSTLLRALGANVVLARAGAPVRARALRLGPLSLGASLCVSDSLVEGRSRFLAEILRLKQIVDLLQAKEPLLFLLDEVLQGTNSHDRFIGARALLRALLEGGAIGLLTTHDLALATIPTTDPTRLGNVHFEDEWRDGALHFDYQLRPGVVTRSNALDLMRSVGIDVREEDQTS